MTSLLDIINDSRQRYNAVGDAFFSDIELMGHVYEAELELSQETDSIEKIYTTSTVIGQREYDYPTNALQIVRVTYNGQRLIPIDFKEDDALTGNREESTFTGTPSTYAIFSDRLFLRPMPDAVQTLKIYTFDSPSELTTTTDSLTTPERYRPFIKDYVLSQMFAKDKNGQMVNYHETRWQRHVNRVKRTEMKREIGDEYRTPIPDELTVEDLFYARR